MIDFIFSPQIFFKKLENETKTFNFINGKKWNVYD